MNQQHTRIHETSKKLKILKMFRSLYPQHSYLFVEQIRIVAHIIGQEVGVGPHHQDVSLGHRIQAAGGDAAHRLVDVQEADVASNFSQAATSSPS